MNKFLWITLTTILLTACTSQIVNPSPTPNASDLPLMAPTSTPGMTASPSAPVQGKAIWETYEKQKNADTAFAGYSIQYPKTWTKKVEENQAIADFNLKKDSYELNIRQAGMGPGKCSSDSKNYVEIDSVIGLLHREKGYSPDKDFTNYSICAKPESGDTYMTPTGVGLITVKAPIPESSETMAEIDAILKTLMKK